jgi:hypothetical protein
LPRIKPALQGVSLLLDRLAEAGYLQAGAPQPQTGHGDRSQVVDAEA